MKKTPLLFAGLVILVAVLAGGYYFMNSKGSNPLTNSTNPIKNMEDALSGSGSMKCEFIDEQGQQVVSFVKAGKMKSVINNGQGMGGMIYKDDTMWTWDSVSKQGFTMSVPKGSESTESVGEFSDYPAADKSELEANIEKYKDQCKEQSIDDSEFNPPTDITFQDMRDLINAMPQQ